MQLPPPERSSIRWAFLVVQDGDLLIAMTGAISTVDLGLRKPLGNIRNPGLQPPQARKRDSRTRKRDSKTHNHFADRKSMHFIVNNYLFVVLPTKLP
ncbi:hypothetical protein FRC19_011238 [Serendipita sp. 401]|nr:hypothetical protein FRC19_011238 [Serendipita sp. 401]